MPPPAAYYAIDSVGRSVFNLVAQPSEERGTCFLICWYFNPRGEFGPESPPLSFRII